MVDSPEEKRALCVAIEGRPGVKAINDRLLVREASMAVPLF
jgi:hypothetical protein